MKLSSRAFLLLPAVSVTLILSSAVDADAFLGRIFSRGKDPVPSVEQRAVQSAKAEQMLAAGQQAERAGKTGSATKTYKRIIKNYPHSLVAPEAQFRYAENLLAKGSYSKAFSAYQGLIENYRSSEHFSTALDRQFQIAVTCQTGKTTKFLGLVPRGMSRKRVTEMYQKVIDNAPRAPHAASAQYNIAQIKEKDTDKAGAIAAYQKVVDDYPRSQIAPKAQIRVGEILQGMVDKGNRNPANLQRTREAYEDFITNFPEHETRDTAEYHIGMITSQEARKSLEVGQFYEKKGNLRAAAIYYGDVRGSSDPAIRQQAEQRLAYIGQRDPSALELVKAAPGQPADGLPNKLKYSPSYVGPPAPDVASARKRRESRLISNEPAPVPIPSNLEEPDLPVSPLDEPELNIDPLVSPVIPPIPETDRLIPGSGDQPETPEPPSGEEPGGTGEEPGDPAPETTPEPEPSGAGAEDPKKSDS